MQYELTNNEINILKSSCNNADTFGIGRLTTAKYNITDEGYEWTEVHERFISYYKSS